MESLTPLKQALNSEPEPQTNPESFKKLVKDSGKKQLAFIAAFLIIAVVLGGTVFAYTQLVKKEDGVKKEEEEVIDQSAWKKCEIGDPINIEVKVPNDWTCDSNTGEGEAGFIEGRLDLASPYELKIYFGMPGPYDTRGESFEESYLETAYIDFDAHIYIENDIEKLAMLIGSTEDGNIVSWVNTKGDNMPTEKELNLIKTIAKTLVVKEVESDTKTFSITKAGKTFEFEYDVNYYAKETTFGETAVETNMYYIDVYDVENVPAPDYASSATVIIINKKKELEGGMELPENLTEDEGLLMNYTANQCFDFNDKKYFESIELNGRKVIKASGKFECVFPVEDGSVDAYNTEAVAYGVSLSDEYYAVIYFTTGDVTEDINDYLLVQIAETIRVN